MAYSCVRVYFEIGHEASLRNKRTDKGFTHDWEVYVKGADNAEIHHFVDKVVFHLHHSFPKPKRTVKEPPYILKESGYAGFSMVIDVYLKNQQPEHRKRRFYYDLTLQTSGPRITKFIKEKVDFSNPSEDFRRKLIRGGGVGVGNDTTTSLEKNNSVTPNSHTDDPKSSPPSGKTKLNNSSSDQPKKHKPKESSKPDESRGSSFADLFGTPIKTVKHSPTSKPPSKSSSSSDIKNLHDKQAKDSSKIPKHSPHKDKEKDKENTITKYKDKEREKEKEGDKSNKEKERTREKEHKEKDKSKDKPKKSSSPMLSKDTRKEENAKRPEENNKDKISSKNNNIKEKKHKEKKHKEDREKKDSHKEHERKEIDREKLNDKIEKKPEIPKEKDVKEIKFKSAEKEEKKSKSIEREKDRSHDSEKQKHKHKRKEKHRKEDEKDRHKKKFKETPPEPIPPPKAKSPTPPPPPPPPVPVKSSITPLNKLIQELSDRDSDSDFSGSMDDEVKSDPPPEPPIKPKIEEKPVEIKEEREKIKKKEKKNKDEDRESKKRKRKTKDKDEPPEKVIKTEVKEESPDKTPPKREERSESPETQFTEDYVTQLRDLQQKIMTLQDNADLQRVVQVISETGQFEITQRTFDFDLCALDRSTVKRLQDMFITAS